MFNFKDLKIIESESFFLHLFKKLFSIKTKRIFSFTITNIDTDRIKVVK